jgi:PAS domain S-box-containing protein
MTDLERTDPGSRGSPPIHVLLVHDDREPAETGPCFPDEEIGGFDVVTERTVGDGLDRLAEERIDCVVSEYRLPDGDGLAFLERVREEYGELPFILYTDDGAGSEALASEAISVGVTDYVRKETVTEQSAILAHRIETAVERHRSRRGVETTEQKRSQIAAQTDDVLFMFDGNWEELLFVNSAYESVWGGSVDELRENPRSFLESVHPEDRDIARRSMERLRDGEPDTVEYRVVTEDDEQRWVRGESKPIRDDDGHVSRITGFVRDITERKVRERELERYEILVEGVTDSIGVVSEDGRIRYENPAIERILGYDPDEFEGTTAFEYMHPDDRAEVMERFHALFSEDGPETDRVEYRIRHADGSWRWLESEASNRPDSALDGYVITSRDITDRKQREETLQTLYTATEEFMDATDQVSVAEQAVTIMAEILDQPLNSVWLHEDDALRPVAASDEAREILGTVPTFERGEGLGWEVFESGEPAVFEDVRAEPDRYNPDTPMGSEILLPLGEYGLMGIGRTEKQEFSEMQVVLSRLLANTVEAALERADRETQLREQRRELERQNERLDEFASIISHDLRNPIQVLEGSLDQARQTGENEQFDRCDRALDRMKQLVSDVLTLAREGETIRDPESVDLSTLAADCWETVDTGDAVLDCPADGVIEADRGQLEQLMANLFGNAVKHGVSDEPSVGDTLGDAVEHGGRGVTVTVGDLDDGFYVEDDGQGIPAAERDSVFQTGYSTATDGTGFGLSIVQKIVDAHGWSITVTEGTDGGARLEIRDRPFDDGSSESPSSSGL